MRAEIDECRRPIRSDDFEREWMPRFSHPFPSLPDPAREFFGVHVGRNTGYETRSLQLGGGLYHRVERIDSRYDQQIDSFALFLGHRNNASEQFSFVVGEELILRKVVLARSG